MNQDLLASLLRMTPATRAYKGTLSAWETICRTGVYHALHSPPDSARSGVHYVYAGTSNPDRPLSAVLECLDPRAGVEAVTAQRNLYGEPFGVRPEAGLPMAFPSCLYPWANPYVCQTPRIAVSYNVAWVTLAQGCSHNRSNVVASANDINRARRSHAVPIQLADGESSHVDSRLIS